MADFASLSCTIKTMVDVIVDQFALGVGDGVFNGMKLLREIEARLTCLDHADKCSADVLPRV